MSEPGIKITVPVVIEMTGEQKLAYVQAYGIGDQAGRVPVKYIVEDVRSYVLNHVQQSAAFGEDGATVTLK